MLGRAAAFESLADARRVVAVHISLVAEELTPATGRALEHASVVESGLRRVEVRVLPYAAHLRLAAAPGLARGGVDSCLAGGSHDIDHLLAVFVVLDPALDDLDAPQVAAGIFAAR